MRTFPLILILILAVGLTGCASRPAGDLWLATAHADRFDDSLSKMVTIGEETPRLLGMSGITMSMRYYPFVGLRDGEILFGIRSGGRHRVPVGDVQVRIDTNPTWTITTAETPLYLAPAPPQVATFEVPKGHQMSKDMAAAMAMSQAATEKAMENMGKIMSPFTAATGDKAKAIIREMLAGNRIIYRTVGLNQAASTEGEVLIDGSFARALSQIGITRDMLN